MADPNRTYSPLAATVYFMGLIQKNEAVMPYFVDTANKVQDLIDAQDSGFDVVKFRDLEIGEQFIPVYREQDVGKILVMEKISPRGNDTDGDEWHNCVCLSDGRIVTAAMDQEVVRVWAGKRVEETPKEEVKYRPHRRGEWWTWSREGPDMVPDPGNLPPNVFDALKDPVWQNANYKQYASYIDSMNALEGAIRRTS